MLIILVLGVLELAVWMKVKAIVGLLPSQVMIVFEGRCFEQLQGLHSESFAAEYEAAGPVQSMICNSHYYMNFYQISKEKEKEKRCSCR